MNLQGLLVTSRCAGQCPSHLRPCCPHHWQQQICSVPPSMPLCELALSLAKLAENRTKDHRRKLEPVPKQNKLNMPSHICLSLRYFRSKPASFASVSAVGTTAFKISMSASSFAFTWFRVASATFNASSLSFSSSSALCFCAMSSEMALPCSQ